MRIIIEIDDTPGAMSRARVAEVTTVEAAAVGAPCPALNAGPAPGPARAGTAAPPGLPSVGATAGPQSAGAAPTVFAP